MKKSLWGNLQAFLPRVHLLRCRNIKWAKGECVLNQIVFAAGVLLFPAVITIAMFETEIPALAFGVVGGLFCDFGLSGTLGFHALVLGVLGAPGFGLLLMLQWALR